MSGAMRKGALAALLILGTAPAAAARSAPPACNEACLTRLASAYVDAMVSRDWQRGVPWADRVRYTENGVGMTVSDGIWATVTKRSAAPLVVADPANGGVVWMGTIEEHGQPSYLALRIKAQGERIAEAEAVIRRKEGRPPFADAGAFVHDPAFLATVPERGRAPRRRLIELAQGYLDSLRTGRVAPATRIAADCVRTENGQVMTSGGGAPANLATGCEGQIRAGLFRDIDRMRGIKFPAVDEKRGIVVAIGLRDYSGRTRPLATPDGRPIPPDAPFPHSYAFVMAFKVQGGAITRIEEVSNGEVPYLMPAWRD